LSALRPGWYLALRNAVLSSDITPRKSPADPTKNPFTGFCHRLAADRQA